MAGRPRVPAHPRPKPKPVFIKCTKAELSERVKVIQELILNGHTRSYILEFGVNKWNMSVEQIDKYRFIANDIISELNHASMEANVALITSNLWSLFRDAKLDKNHDLARKILCDIAKFKGLDQTTTIHILDKSRPHSNLTDEELDNLIEVNNE